MALTIFEKFDADVLWPRSRTVQGHPRSKVTVPIDSLRVVSYWTSTDTIIVGYLSPLLKHLMCNFTDLDKDSSRSSTVKVHSADRKPIGGFISDLHCVQHSNLSPVSRHLMLKYLDLGRFKVIKHQRSRCQSIAHMWFPNSYLTSIDTIIIYVTFFEIFDVEF